MKSAHHGMIYCVNVWPIRFQCVHQAIDTITTSAAVCAAISSFAMNIAFSTRTFVSACVHEQSFAAKIAYLMLAHVNAKSIDIVVVCLILSITIKKP